MLASSLYSGFVNLILFEIGELGKPLSRRDDRAVHLLKVLRKKNGDTFDAGIIGGGRGTGRIEKIGLDGSVSFSLDANEDPPSRLPVRVAVGFPRPIQIRRLLRDLSSLGVGAIDLFGTELGEKSYRDTKLFKDGGARAALVEGAVQSRDTVLPELSVFAALEDWLKNKGWEKGVFGGVAGASPAEGGSGRLPQAGWSGGGGSPLLSRSPILIAADNIRSEGAMSRLIPMNRPVVLAIGAERGWSDGEREMLENAGFVRLSLGSRALRTETACIAAAVLAIEKIGGLE